jgi:hypothetical protein
LTHKAKMDNAWQCSPSRLRLNRRKSPHNPNFLTIMWSAQDIGHSMEHTREDGGHQHRWHRHVLVSIGRQGGRRTIGRDGVDRSGSYGRVHGGRRYSRLHTRECHLNFQFLVSLGRVDHQRSQGFRWCCSCRALQGVTIARAWCNREL